MFGIGFTELLLISIVAILFLGPEKLPQALVDMAKFIKSVKRTIGDAKSSLEEEIKIADLKTEALDYKKQLNEATDELKNFKNIDFDEFDDVTYDSEVSKESPSKKLSVPKKDPYAHAPSTINEPLEDDIKATPVEPKNSEVTFKKKEKIKKSKDKNTPKKSNEKKEDS